jgi:hypothetical protein
MENILRHDHEQQGRMCQHLSLTLNSYRPFY